MIRVEYRRGPGGYRKWKDTNDVNEVWKIINNSYVVLLQIETNGKLEESCYLKGKLFSGYDLKEYVQNT